MARMLGTAPSSTRDEGTQMSALSGAGMAFSKIFSRLFPDRECVLAPQTQRASQMRQLALVAALIAIPGCSAIADKKACEAPLGINNDSDLREFTSISLEEWTSRFSAKGRGNYLDGQWASVADVQDTADMLKLRGAFFYSARTFNRMTGEEEVKICTVLHETAKDPFCQCG